MATTPALLDSPDIHALNTQNDLPSLPLIDSSTPSEPGVAPTRALPVLPSSFQAWHKLFLTKLHSLKAECDNLVESTNEFLSSIDTSTLLFNDPVMSETAPGTVTTNGDTIRLHLRSSQHHHRSNPAATTASASKRKQHAAAVRTTGNASYDDDIENDSSDEYVDTSAKRSRPASHEDTDPEFIPETPPPELQGKRPITSPLVLRKTTTASTTTPAAALPTTTTTTKSAVLSSSGPIPATARTPSEKTIVLFKDGAIANLPFVLKDELKSLFSGNCQWEKPYWYVYASGTSDWSNRMNSFASKNQLHLRDYSHMLLERPRTVWKK
jgi:hypothetical protein